MLTTEVKCPTCNKPVIWSESICPPFCTARCKLIDLGAWVGEDHRIPDDPTWTPEE